MDEENALRLVNKLPHMGGYGRDKIWELARSIIRVFIRLLYSAGYEIRKRGDNDG